MQRYVHTKLQEFFFGKFPIILTECLERLVENTRRYKAGAPRNWTPELVRQLNSVSNTTTHAIDFWLDSILGGYITDFFIDRTQSYSVEKRDFFKGTHKRFMK